jgi:hypothetical protein
MKVALYGMPGAGKTHILEMITFMEVISGSQLLRQCVPDFDQRDEAGRCEARRYLAALLASKSDFILDGHYAFGDEIAFTDSDGQLYDAFLYLYVDPATLRVRMAASSKNARYLQYNIEEWQRFEITQLRNYCHRAGKDFYVIDNPPCNVFEDVSLVVDFIHAVYNGFSCLSFAKSCAAAILRQSEEDTITLLDGDKTLTIEDTSGTVLDYKTNLYDGNFYTGYQSWRQAKDFHNLVCPPITYPPVHLREDILYRINGPAFILTSGHTDIWKNLSENLCIPYFCGPEMSADTKLFITKELQKNGKRVIAYGDSLNDYYMLKQANQGYLITKADGTVSRSLRGMDLEGLTIV